MIVTELTRARLSYRREVRDRHKGGWEYVGDGGGKLWEIDRGYRWRCIITDVSISKDGKGLWVKIKDK